MFNSRILIVTIGISIMILIGIIININRTDTAPKVMAPMITPTPVVSGVIIDWGVQNERLMVVETLIIFNKSSNDLFTFLKRTNQIEDLEGHPFHKRYIISTLIIDALNLYESSVLLWKPPASLTMYYQLAQMKESELYRISKFKEYLSAIQIALVNEDEPAIQEGFKNLKEWGISTKNKESTQIQQDILRELKIDEEEVNFKYKNPTTPSSELMENMHKEIQ